MADGYKLDYGTGILKADLDNPSQRARHNKFGI
jgi:hypothetical protein